MLSLPLLLFPLLGILFIWKATPPKDSSEYIPHPIISGTGKILQLKFVEKSNLNPEGLVNTHAIPLLLSILNLVHTLILMFLHQSTTGGFQFQLVIFDRLIAGIDGISLWLILLVNIIIPIVILNNWSRRGVTNLSSSQFFLTLILLINLLSILVFLVLDLLLFYISFEAIL
jgi:NADH:ubiquinone oxidoreductase subunit 4 (subunit M)